MNENTDAATLRRQAYGAAEQTLKERHHEEFRTLVEAEAARRGVEYTFRKTKAERAAEKVAALLAEYPELREQFGDHPATP